MGRIGESRVYEGGRFRAILSGGSAVGLRYLERELLHGESLDELHARVARLVSLDDPDEWKMSIDELLVLKDLKNPDPSNSISRIADEDRAGASRAAPGPSPPPTPPPPTPAPQPAGRHAEQAQALDQEDEDGPDVEDEEDGDVTDDDSQASNVASDLVYAFDRGRILSYLEASGWRWLTDQAGDFRVEFAYSDDTGGELSLWLTAGGDSELIYEVVVQSTRRIAKADWQKAIEVCNRWNAEQRWPTAYLAIPEDESASSAPILLERHIDLTFGIHQDLLDDFTRDTFNGSLKFWRWAQDEQGL